MTSIGRPDPAEYNPYYEKYISLVSGDDPVRAMREQIAPTLATLRGISPQDSLRRYAAGKWSLREVVGHMTDAERVFAYRALWFARGDQSELPGFEQDPWMAASSFERREWPDLLAELEAVRRTSVLLFSGLAEGAWRRSGVASKNKMSVRAVAFIIAGHELHHMKIVRERYLAAAQHA